MNDVSPMVARIKESPTVAIFGKALAMKRAGQDVISVSGGEPDFDTPDHVKEAAIRAIRGGETKYTAVDGTAALKDAIIAKFNRENGLSYAPDQISVGTGGKQVIFNAMLASIAPGDEVIIPRPYWVSYPDIALLAGGVPVFVDCPRNNRFKLRPEDLEQAITPRSRWLILNSPSNPTGAAYTADELKAIAEVALRHPRLMILSDDIYEHLIYDEFEFRTIASVAPALAERTVTVNGASKAFCMTGWRIGYGGGPKWLIKAMAKLQGQCTNNPCSVSQAAAVAALTGPQDFIAEHNVIYKQRRDLAVDLLNKVEGITCDRPEGAFYLYPSIAGLIGKRAPDGRVIENDGVFAEYLLDSVGVAVVPGAGFGLSPYMRIAYPIATEDLREACLRIQRASAALR
ncbi:MAG: pyridoxal phosphate-dependent aminotransferase [Alphaproteobacteria bacterium]